MSPPKNFHQQTRDTDDRETTLRKGVSFSPSNAMPINNPEDDYFSQGPGQNYYDFSSSRLAHIGKRKIVPANKDFGRDDETVMMNKSRIHRFEDDEYSDSKISLRRREFNEEMDRNLRDAFSAVDRSKNQTVDIEE